MLIQVEVFWVVMPCSDVGYECFGETCCLHLQGENLISYSDILLVFHHNSFNVIYIEIHDDLTLQHS